MVRRWRCIVTHCWRWSEDHDGHQHYLEPNFKGLLISPILRKSSITWGRTLNFLSAMLNVGSQYLRIIFAKIIANRVGNDCAERYSDDRSNITTTGPRAQIFDRTGTLLKNVNYTFSANQFNRLPKTKKLQKHNQVVNPNNWVINSLRVVDFSETHTSLPHIFK